jgi:hypothetical protein
MLEYCSLETIGAATPQESDGSAIHPYLSFSMGAAAPLRNGRVSGVGDARLACLLSAS